MSEFVRPDQKTILREPSNIVCKEDDRLRLLVVVYSAPVYYERRRIIRKTWGDALRKIPGIFFYYLRKSLYNVYESFGEPSLLMAMDNKNIWVATEL